MIIHEASVDDAPGISAFIFLITNLSGKDIARTGYPDLDLNTVVKVRLGSNPASSDFENSDK